MSGQISVSELNERADKVMDLITEYGGIDGDHHKQWVIDQCLRIIAGDSYDFWVEQYEEGGEYSWDVGIAP